AALDEAGDAASRGLDLARGQLPVGGRLETVLAEADLVRDIGQALVAALVDLAVLGALGLQHFTILYWCDRPCSRASRSGRPDRTIHFVARPIGRATCRER